MATQLRHRKGIQIETLGLCVANLEERQRLHRKALYLLQLSHCDVSAKSFSISYNGFCPARTNAGNFLQHRCIGMGKVDVCAQLNLYGISNGIPVVFLIGFIRVVLLVLLVGFVQFSLFFCPPSLVIAYGFHRESRLIVVANGYVGFQSPVLLAG